MEKALTKIELLAPAGNFEKLEIAAHYGADAVYVGGENYSLRNFSDNFNLDGLAQAVSFARRAGIKIYIACNVFSRNREQEDIADYLKYLGQIQPDAVIVADPGIVSIARGLIPEIPLHLSTQANTTNISSVRFWGRLGIRRINVARELSLREIREMSDRFSIEIEAFAHGAMCISYSGRCLLSSFLAGRDANRGMCSHPCRWKYAVVEALRPGEYMPLGEDQHGSYIFNSSDLCMIEHIPQLIQAGLDAIKIEGRMKGIHYLATTVKTYRSAIDAYYTDPSNYHTAPEWMEELCKISNRGYCTGFYFGDPEQIKPNYRKGDWESKPVFVGKVIGASGPDGVAVEVRNKIFEGESVEVLRKQGPTISDRIHGIIDTAGEPIPFAQPGSLVNLVLRQPCSPNDLLRRPVTGNDDDPCRPD